MDFLREIPSSELSERETVMMLPPWRRRLGEFACGSVVGCGGCRVAAPSESMFVEAAPLIAVALVGDR